MQITIHYEAQAKRAAGVRSETIEVTAPCRVNDCIRQLADSRSDTLKPILLNAEGNVQPTLLIFKGDEQIGKAAEVELSDGDTLTIMTPISGG